VGYRLSISHRLTTVGILRTAIPYQERKVSISVYLKSILSLMYCTVSVADGNPLAFTPHRRRPVVSVSDFRIISSDVR
jgi:hypothetical protein